MTSTRPATIRTTDELEDLLSDPSPGLIEMMKSLPGDILILGAAGKMGPTLARMAKRATDAAGSKRRVIAVSRFSNPQEKTKLTNWGIETIAADLLDAKQLNALPDAPNIVYMAGMKFGATGNEPLTWAMNAHLPAMVCEKFPRSRIVAFSTGNVYGLSPIVRGGSRESDPLVAVGDYAMSCVGRERMFQHFSIANKTPVALIRLNYATETRYGVMVDLAAKVWGGEPVPLSMGNFNAIWQGDANSMSLEALAHTTSPASVFNIAGPEILSVRAVCEEFAALMKKSVTFTGEESPDALLSNAQLSHNLFGYPRVPVKQMIHWIADWTLRGGENINKPTHFETRDGRY
jgi:nucleoside-diphosphate-sugar epimerase